MPRYYTYILTNDYGNVMYVGVTNNLERRVNEHKSGLIKGFTSKYNVHKLVHVEEFDSVNDAIAREKEIKKWSRAKKDALVGKNNPSWKDLAAQ